jgi:hypothetical protein
LLYGDKGTLKASTMSYDFVPLGKGKAIHKDCVYEKKEYPEDLTEPDIEQNAAPATRLQMKDFLTAVKSRGKPVAAIEEGHISTAACILANLSMHRRRFAIRDTAAGQRLPRPPAGRRVRKEEARHRRQTLAREVDNGNLRDQRAVEQVLRAPPRRTGCR